MSTVFSCLLMFFISVTAFAQYDAAPENVQFCQMKPFMKEIRKTPAAQDNMIRSYLRYKQVVYISGYLGCSPGEFADNQKVIQSIDPTVPVTTICPPSDISVENNVEFIRSNLKALSAKNQFRSFILIGQSKGGAEALQTAVLTRDAFKPMVTSQLGYAISDVVSLDGALGGSLLADLALDLNPDLTTKWHKFLANQQIPDSVMGLVKFYLKTDTEGFHSMTTQASRARTRALIDGLDRVGQRILHDRVLFVSSVRGKGADDMPFYMQLLAGFMRDAAPANDGLIQLTDQSIGGLGTRFINVSEAGHFSLVGPQDKSECRTEFSRYLLLKLAQWEGR